MHSHPASKGQPSASPPGVFPAHTSSTSAYINSGTQPINSVQSPNSDPPPPDHTHQSAIGAPQFKSDSVSAHWVEQLQLALAIANPELLQQLVLHCQSPLVAPHQLGSISAAVSVPVDGTQAADSVLSLEVISCELSQASGVHASARREDTVKLKARALEAAANPAETMAAEAIAHQRALVNQVCRETKLQTLGMNIPLPEAIALLQYATFSLPDIQRILNLPYNGWHRSWWAMVDTSVDQTLGYTGVNPVGFTIPFKRLIRSRRYADGTVMLQYKDQFSHVPPPCFRTQQQSVLVHIQRPGQNISAILAWMNHARTALKAEHSLLLYHQLSPVEQQALRNQGIYLYHCASADPVHSSATPSHSSYPNRELHNLAKSDVVLDSNGAHTPEISTNDSSSTEILADCSLCIQQQCPMHGQKESPVTACRRFSI